MGRKLEAEKRLERAIERVLASHKGTSLSGFTPKEELQELEAAFNVWREAGGAP